MKKVFYFFLFIFLGFVSTKAQATGDCNQYSKWISSNYSMTVEDSRGWFGEDKWSNKNNLINGSSSPAGWGTILAGQEWIEARNATQFPAGYYAGMVVGDADLVSLGASMKVTTYLNGTEQESRTYGSFVGTIMDGSKRKIGFVTAKPFNRIRLTVNGGITLIFTAQAYYAETMKPCAATALQCNVATPLVSPAFGAIIENSRTGLNGIGVLEDTEKAVDANTGNYALLGINAGILGSAQLSVRDMGDTFAAGTFAGFDVENSNLISLGALSNVTVKTYLNGVFQEQRTGQAQLLSLPALDYQNRTTIGFETTKPFNEVQFVLGQPLGVTLGVTKVFGAVIKKFCEGTPFSAWECNKQVVLNESNYPVYISSVRTGIFGVASVLASVTEPDNATDTNPDNYASIKVPVTIGTVASLSVRKALSPYTAGTYAGFEISNPSLLNAQLLQNITLTTYRNGVQQEQVSGNGIVLGAGTSLIAGSGRYVMGFVSKKEFDELQISINSVAGANIGETKVYGMVAARLCATAINCNSSYYWAQPQFPVVLNAQRTGFSSIVSVASSVKDPDNVIDSNTSNYSRITVAAGLLDKGSISVMDPTAVYPKGTYAGFTVRDRYFIVQGDLFEFLTVKTYLNGVLQESKTSTDLIDLTLLIPIAGTGTKNAGFYTTKPFNEVRIEVSSLASIINITDVYGVTIDTRLSDTSDGSIHCTTDIKAVDDTYTIPAGGNSGTALVINNDTVKGNPATLSKVNVTQVSTTNPGVTISQSPAILQGLVKVEAGTPPGTYELVYRICDKTLPSNCDTATVYVTVPAQDADIIASPDSYTVITTGGSAQTTPSVLANDTYNGNPATTTNVTATGINVPAGLTLNPDGTISVAGNTPAGTYTVDYQICDKNNAGNCKSSVATVVVQAVVANNDSFTVNSGSAPANTPSVLGNDTYNGKPATAADVTVTGTNIPAGWVVNVDGTITVPPNTIEGAYTVTYQICDNAVAGNCDTATAIVTVKGVPDMTPTLSFSQSTVKVGQTIQVFYHVKNVGTAPSAGTITLTANKPVQGTSTFTPNIVQPSGWASSQSVSNWVFTSPSGFVLAPGDEAVLVMDYTLISGDSNINFIGRVGNNSGGETNNGNNTASQVMVISN